MQRNERSFMSPKHAFLLVVFLAVAIAILYVFYRVYRSSLPFAVPRGGLANANQKRLIFFLLLAGIAVILSTVSFARSPYFTYSDEDPSEVVYVAARQFAYVLSREAIDPQGAAAAPQPIQLHAGKVVEFRVTSLDVNHGFAIYNDRGHLLAQTQAMPGYVNRLRWKFDEPGTYQLLCIEFCGAAHAYMSASFDVISGNESSTR